MADKESQISSEDGGIVGEESTDVDDGFFDCEGDSEKDSCDAVSEISLNWNRWLHLGHVATFVRGGILASSTSRVNEHSGQTIFISRPRSTGFLNEM